MGILYLYALASGKFSSNGPECPSCTVDRPYHRQGPHLSHSEINTGCDPFRVEYPLAHEYKMLRPLRGRNPAATRLLTLKGSQPVALGVRSTTTLKGSQPLFVIFPRTPVICMAKRFSRLRVVAFGIPSDPEQAGNKPILAAPLAQVTYQEGERDGRKALVCRA